MESYSLFTLAVLCVLILTFYKYLTKNNGYWKSRGIPEAAGAILGLGHTLDIYRFKKSPTTLLYDICRAHPNDSMVGVYMGRTPVLVVKHPEVIKFILQTGFSNFCENVTVSAKYDPLLVLDPFFSNGQSWKNSRGLFISALSAKRVRNYMPTITDACEKLVNYLKIKVPENGTDIEVKNLYSKFTASAGISAVLGIDGHTFEDKQDPWSFLEMAKGVFNESGDLKLQQNLVSLFPFLDGWLQTYFTPQWVNSVFPKIVNDIVSVKSDSGAVRNDIYEIIVNYLKEKNLEPSMAVQHAFVFFMEWYETSSLTLSFTTYFIAKYQNIQKKIRQELDEVMEKHGTISTYEALNDMTYLEQVIKESIRLFPPGGRMVRICTKPVTLEGPDGLSCTLEPGNEVHIPVYAYHRDPEFWEKADEFIPERFDKADESTRHKKLYLSFGEGPRTCPGIKLGLLQVKAALATILDNYVIEPSQKLKEPVKVHPRYFLMTLFDGFWIRFRRRK